MPFGVSDAVWNMLPEEDKAAIKASYNAANPPPPSPTDPYDIDFTQLGLDYDAYKQQQAGVSGGYPLSPMEQFLQNNNLQGEILDIMAGFSNRLGDTGPRTIGPSAAHDYFQFNQLPQQGSYDGSGGGYLKPSDFSYTGPKTAKFSDLDINIAGSPAWWKAVSPDVLNPVSEYQTLSNLLIPFLSPEDQYTAATNLFQSDNEAFSRYNPESIFRSPAPLSVTPEMRHKYFTGERAQKTLDAFDSLLSLSGRKAEDFGPGYGYLRGLADTHRDFGLTSGANQLTETQSGQLLSALDPQLAQSKSGNLAAYGPIAQSFSLPFFSGGSLTGSTKNSFNQIIQPPNPKYF